MVSEYRFPLTRSAFYAAGIEFLVQISTTFFRGVYAHLAVGRSFEVGQTLSFITPYAMIPVYWFVLLCPHFMLVVLIFLFKSAQRSFAEFPRTLPWIIYFERGQSLSFILLSSVQCVGLCCLALLLKLVVVTTFLCGASADLAVVARIIHFNLFLPLCFQYALL
jgi:hypothetical protein